MTTAARGELAANHVGGVTRMWAATGETASQGALRRSTDGGATWSAPLTGGVGFCNPQCFYDVAVAAHPTLRTRSRWADRPRSCQRALDGRRRHVPVVLGGAPRRHARLSRTRPPTRRSSTSARDGGIWRSSDQGQTWTSRNNTQFHATQFQSIALHPSDREFMLGGTQDNGTIYKLPDGSWIRTDGGDGGYALIDQNATDVTNVTQYHTYFNNATPDPLRAPVLGGGAGGRLADLRLRRHRERHRVQPVGGALLRADRAGTGQPQHALHGLGHPVPLGRQRNHDAGGQPGAAGGPGASPPSRSRP